MAAALARLPGLSDIRPGDLALLETKGIAHDHVRVNGRKLLVRVPRPGQFAIPPQAYIPYQAASFARATPSGHVPRLVATIAPSAELPTGALLIEEIEGRTLDLPRELPLVAECLARIHALPVPAERAPLQAPANPVRGMLEVIERQMVFLAATRVAPAARAMIDEELAWAKDFARTSDGRDQPVTLIATDSHPGNYLVDQPPNRPTGRAIFIDIERMQYSSPAIDLAHATLYTSTTWDIDCGIALAPADIASFYRDYLGRIDAALAARLKPWLMPMRRLTWLRTTTWAARFFAEVLSEGLAGDSASRYVAHAEARIADFLAGKTISAIRREWLEGAVSLPA